MAEPKTKPTDVDVTAFLDAVPDERRRAEGHAARALMERITGEPATMWGPSIVGFGSQHYEGKSSSGEMIVVGFSPRKAALTFYGLYNDYGPPDPLFEKLGPHTTGKGCLYLKRLDAVDAAVLEQLVREAWEARGRGSRASPSRAIPARNGSSTPPRRPWRAHLPFRPSPR